MNSNALNMLLQDLVNEYGHYENCSFSIDARHLSLSDKKLILSHLLDCEDYAAACRNPTAAESYFNEYQDKIQSLLDNTAQDIYESFMEEAGLCYGMRADNGELYVRRR